MEPTSWRISKRHNDEPPCRQQGSRRICRSLQYESLCTDIGESQADVALAWLLRNPGVTAPIIGPRTDRQLESALHAAEIKLSDDVLKELDRIFPGPGGEAPEAYAW